MGRKRANTREHLLRTALGLVAREGVTRLTLEAVAAEAGVSKGGLLYHFRTKRDLIAGMVDYLGSQIDAALARHLAEDETRGLAGSVSRAYLETMAEPGAQGRRPALLGGGPLAAIASDPTLLEPLRERYTAWQIRLIANGLPPPVATAIRLAADGLWFAELFGFAPPTADLRDQVLAYLVGLSTITGEDPHRADGGREVPPNGGPSSALDGSG